ncbi:MAG: ABC transporter permease [Candidatus Altiarchaeota archaeon]
MPSHYLPLIRELAWTDFKLRYNRSILGFLWSLLKPLLMLVTLYLVFHVLMRWDIQNYELFLLLGIVEWNFFVEGTLNSMNNILAKGNLIKKVYFPREFVVLSSCLSSSLTFALNLAVFFAFMLALDVMPGWQAMMMPVLVVELFILVLGLSLALSALYVMYRDMVHIWEVLLQVGFWVSPIVYSVDVIPERYVKWYMLNPIARVIKDSRDAVISHGIPSLRHMTITLVICLVILAAGYAMFRKLSPKIPETL